MVNCVIHLKGIAARFMIAVIHTLSQRVQAIRQWLMAPATIRFRWQAMAEIGLILLWAIFVGRAYLDMDPMAWPGGREFGMAIQPHFIWTQLRSCGSCVLWNGFSNGGYPAFTDLHAGVLHPVVIVATLIWGGLNGTKIVLISGLAMAGLAQWWLARVMGLGRVARLWGAGMAVVGGHLAGRMESGVVGVVISTAACSLVLAPGLKLALHGRQRDVVPLAITLALALISGQGYLQLGLVFGILPAFALFFLDEKLMLRKVWRYYFLAGLLALLMAAVFLVPLLHYWPEFAKDIDTTFSWVQPIQYVLLNLVISDLDFYKIDSLGKISIPYANINFIGWIPVLLSLLGLRLVPRSQQRVLTFFWVAGGLILLASSGVTFKMLQPLIQGVFSGVRTASLIAGLLVPLVLGTAAWSIDRLLQLNWPVLIFSADETGRYPRLTISLSGIILAFILALGLANAYRFSQLWLGIDRQNEGAQQVIEEARTVGAQWVALPYGEHFWGPLAAEAGLKLTNYVLPWHWSEREPPGAYLATTRSAVADNSENLKAFVDGVNLLIHPENQYARVKLSDDDEVPCRAIAQGGDIDVFCQQDAPGKLVLLENRWFGWQVTRDGQSADLLPGRWLSTPAPAGYHQYAFRYRPWDVTVGLGLSLLGWILAGWIWWRLPAEPDPNNQANQSES